MLDNREGIIVLWAAKSLTQIGPLARSAGPKLAQLVEDRRSFEIRQAICAALGRVGVDDNGYPTMLALNALVRSIDDPSKEVRLEALQSIVNLGPPPAGDLSVFKNLIEQRIKKDKDQSVVIWVRVALAPTWTSARRPPARSATSARPRRWRSPT
jgi:HEAT repeat protein